MELWGVPASQCMYRSRDFPFVICTESTDQDIARIEKIANEYLPFPTEYRIALPSDTDTAMVENTLNTNISSLDLRWAWNRNASTGLGEASQNVWKRAYRREHDRKNNRTAAAAGREDIEIKDEAADKEVRLAFRISINQGAGEVLIEWLRGSDQVLWESFCGMLHRTFKKG